MGKQVTTQSTLWFKSEAKRFEEALPTGNGRLGIMDYGNGSFLINEESLWSGTAKLRTPQVSNKHQTLDTVREHIFNDRIEEAENLLSQQLLGNWKETYLPCAKLHLQLSSDSIEFKTRSLDLSEGITMFENNQIHVQTFVSQKYASAILCVDSSEEFEDGIGYTVEPLLESTCVYELEDVLIVDGYCPSKVPSYDESNQSIIYDASKPCIRYSLAIKKVVINKKRTLFYLTVKTNYEAYGSVSDLSSTELANLAATCVQQAASKKYESVVQQHRSEMKAFFSKTFLVLPENENSSAPTDERRLLYRESADDYALIALYFNYGRYLLQQSSTKGSLPANLQGIWNEQVRAPWCSNFTTNINIQMNYWHAQVANLDDSFDALANMMIGLCSQPDPYVSEEFKSEGLMINHNLDGWFTRGPVKGSPSWAYWPMASIWLGIQLFEHLRFHTSIKQKNTYLPVFVAIAKFAVGWMIEDEKGNVQTCPSTSPENLYLLDNDFEASVSYSSTMDIMMLHEFSELFIKLTEELQCDSEVSTLAKAMASKVERLPKIKIHPEGYLKEWQHSYREKDIGHRHLSHLFGFFPGSYMFKEEEAYIEAGKEALFRRIRDGGDFTSWHCTWVINLLARFGEQQEAKRYLDLMIGELTCPNLFSSHRRRMDGEELFQIDGNFGGARAISELILQDYNATVSILPVAGSFIPQGEAIGLRIRNGHHIDLSWENGSVTKLIVHGNVTENLTLKVGQEQLMIGVKEGVTTRVI